MANLTLVALLVALLDGVYKTVARQFWFTLKVLFWYARLVSSRLMRHTFRCALMASDDF
jgi:hypothetical protein